MELASCTIKLSNMGNEVHLPAVTPAEVYLLRHIHHKNAGGDPVINIKKTGETGPAYTNQRELARLSSKYGMNAETRKPKIVEFYPGANPALPKTFEEVTFEQSADSSQSQPHGHEFLPGEPGYVAPTAEETAKEEAAVALTEDALTGAASETDKEVED